MLGAQSRSSDKDSKYRHLADPGQKDVFFSRGEAAILCFGAKRVVGCDCAPSAFSQMVAVSLPIRTSHPSGSRRWGCAPWWGQTPGPWLFAAPEMPQCPAMSKCCGALQRTAPGSQIGGSSLRGGPTLRSVHDGGASAPSFASRRQDRDAAAPNHVRWLLANTPAGSPPQPLIAAHANALFTSKAT